MTRVLPIDEPRLSAQLVGERLGAIAARLGAAATAADRDPGSFRIVAVTKGFGLDAVQAALGAGIRILGESRVQEGLLKIDAEPAAEWHLIGRLQGNKVRPAVRAFEAIHAVDSLELLTRIDRISGEEGCAPRLLLEVNLSGAPTRAGFDPTWFGIEAGADAQLARALREVKHARPVGLMTIAPAGVSHDVARACFATLRRMRDALEERVGPLPELSMGMTSDAEAAVAEGATLVRVGTGLFGPRPG